MKAQVDWVQERREEAGKSSSEEGRRMGGSHEGQRPQPLFMLMDLLAKEEPMRRGPGSLLICSLKSGGGEVLCSGVSSPGPRGLHMWAQGMQAGRWGRAYMGTLVVTGSLAPGTWQLRKVWEARPGGAAP